MTKEKGKLLNIMDDPEFEMDKALYNISHRSIMVINIRMAGGKDMAMEEITRSLRTVLGNEKLYQMDITKDGHVLIGYVRIFRTQEGLDRWIADAPLREIEKKLNERRS